MINPYFTIDTFEFILLGILFTLFLIQLLYCLLVYQRPYRSRNKQLKPLSVSYPPVSVIVYAKNESINLKEHLPLLLSQDYPHFEVIVVNDGSTDESEDVLSHFETQYENLYHTFIPQESRYLSRKKLALTVGIKAAKNDILLFIEANCIPVTNRWIYQMVQPYQQSETEIVLGYCTYRKTKGLLHKLVSYDNLVTGLQYISSALAGHPFKGNGRNLSYRKELFFKNKGFSNSLQLHAGEDDLFINTCANGKNTYVEYSPQSITEVEPVHHFKIWKEIKVSRAATQRYYRLGSLVRFRFEAFTYLMFMLMLLFSVCIGLVQMNFTLPVTALSLFFFYYLAKGIVFYQGAKLLLQKPLTIWLPFLDILLYFVNVYVRVYRMFRGKNDYTFRVPGKK